MEADVLHRNVSTKERIKTIHLIRLSDLLCAPGHTSLRNPPSVHALSDRIRSGGDLLDLEPVVLNAFTKTNPDKSVRLVAVQCMDGNHRLAASVLAGVETIGHLQR